MRPQFSQTDISQELLRLRYLKRDPAGNIVETPGQMYMRVAQTMARVERQHNEPEEAIRQLADVFYQLMSEGKFLPNSPTLMNAGRADGSLSACFVLPIKDSIEEIFETVKNTAIIQKAGGGTGFSFDKLRPTGDIITSSGGTSSGPISFWRILDETTNAIQQGAHRRGANIGMMSIIHPDILKFMHAKQDTAAFNNFNISVKITDAFMDTLRRSPDALHIVVNPRTQRAYAIPKTVDVHAYGVRDLVPAYGDKSECYSVQDIWQMIIVNAHATGEPGICYIDRINEHNPTPQLGTINATNPCGEQPLLDYEACNLGSLNISKFVRSDGSDLDWQNLAEAATHAIRFLDNVIDANSWPIPEIREASLGSRKIGLGVMGFADALVLLGIRYNSNQAIKFAGQLSQFIRNKAHCASQQLAQQRGCFPNWQGSIWDTEHRVSMRNATCTTIAPTGSISIIAQCSSGIEPIYSLAFKRRTPDSTEFKQVHPLVERLGSEQGWINEKTWSMLASGTEIRNIRRIPPKIADLLVTAHEIAPEWHVRVQAAFQSSIDNAVSKTVNLPDAAPVEDVGRVFQLAYDLGCKGVTVYRDRSRKNQVLSTLRGFESGSNTGLEPGTRV